MGAPLPFQYWPDPGLQNKPCWAVDTLIYQLGPTFLNGAYFQVVDIQSMVVPTAWANDFFATCQKLGYKLAASLTNKVGNVIKYNIIQPDGRDYWCFAGPESNGYAYEGNLAGYFAVENRYNDVNGGGVGNSGSWTLPAGAAEPVWTPTPYVAPVAAA